MVASGNPRRSGKHFPPLVICTSLFLLFLASFFNSLRAQTYDPNDTVTEYSLRGTIYHHRFEGRKTSNGEIFDHNLFTAAHHKFKFGTLLLVTNPETELSVIVKINDRCAGKRVVDLTNRAANGIGIKGRHQVTVRVLPPSYADEWAAQDAKFDSVPSRLATGKYAYQHHSQAKKTFRKSTRKSHRKKKK